MVHAFRKAVDERMKMAKMTDTLQEGDDESTESSFEKACFGLLDAFDIDGSGELDEEELLDLARTTYAEVPVKHVHAACLEARKFADQHGHYGAVASATRPQS
eukprot:6239329-Prymnesium_polylepis.2